MEQDLNILLLDNNGFVILSEDHEEVCVLEYYLFIYSLVLLARCACLCRVRCQNTGSSGKVCGNRTPLIPCPKEWVMDIQYDRSEGQHAIQTTCAH